MSEKNESSSGSTHKKGTITTGTVRIVKESGRTGPAVSNPPGHKK